jgi:hypothetical protein
MPQDYTWFAVNNQGLTMLDQDKDFIFMNALTEGTQSLSQAITMALKGEGGAISYDLGSRTRHGVYSKLPNLDWRLILVKVDEPESRDKALISLDTFGSELQQRLANLDQHVRKTIAKHPGSWDKASAIRQSMTEMLQQQQMVVDVAFVDESGKIRYVEPSEYKNSEGKDISKQEHVTRLRKDKKPILSSGFQAVEGFTAVSLAYPVFKGKSELAGSVSLLINPQLMVESIIKDINIPASHELWIMETSGFMLYDADPQEIGKNLFSDTMYKDYDSLLKLGKEIAANSSGKGEYVFQSAGHSSKVLKKASWLTVRLHDQEWRVVIAEQI